mmetsp:Transcript_4914/g.8099  ORF Transcript_4914/g.8099 Transcript_4914/m.8099 type:complete len:398 (+) Transcript_4914:324-1517(+)|eukprot:CAMPEP_0119012210 /NCGR_PEP_ID=MMETSP1176-20130426/6152_1 /TAXON_ID=265551 /ORGANISM="Synedropsis recta cf, Strain CCMP1620" /LENGTH=397 /DNA_ID=CAMNT_0006965131 /DNA_START=234 /DNA_END=1427 /DNA_ORIENTATION=-
MSTLSSDDDDVESFFGANSSYPLQSNVWTPDDRSMGRAMVHHYQCHTLPSLQQQQQAACCSSSREETEQGGGSSSCNIPRLIHFIWLGNKPLPLTTTATTTTASNNNVVDIVDGENECIRSWRRHHPNWTIQVWRDDDLGVSKNTANNNQPNQWFNAPALQYALRHENYGMASDILRLELLWEYGGIYVDIDYLCVDVMDDLHLHNDHFDFYCGASRTFAVEVNNGLLGAPRPHHFIIQRLMERIHTWFAAQQLRSSMAIQNQPPPADALDVMAAFLDPASRSTFQQVMTGAALVTDTDVIRHTGPGLLTTTLAQAIMMNDDSSSSSMSRVAIFPFHIFHPLPNSFRGHSNILQDEQQELLEEHIVKGQTKAVHLWQCSWQHNRTTTDSSNDSNNAM